MEITKLDATRKAEILDLVKAAYGPRAFMPREYYHCELGPLVEDRWETGVLKTLAGGNAVILGIQRGARLVGLVECWIEAETAGNAKTVKVGWLCTHPRYRRRRVASTLLEEAVRFARSNGATRLVANTWIDTQAEPVVRFLRAAGFTALDADKCGICMGRSLRTPLPPIPPLPEGYRLRHFQTGDELRWTAVRNRCFDCNDPPEVFYKQFASNLPFDPEEMMFIEHAGEIVSMCGAVLDEVKLAGRPFRYGRLHWVATLPEHRGKGLGEISCIAALHYVKRKGLDHVCLITQPYRKPAIALYEKLGMRLLAASVTYARSV